MQNKNYVNSLKLKAKEKLLGHYNLIIPALLMISIFHLLVNNISISMDREPGFRISFILYLIFSAISILLLTVFSIGKANLFLNVMTNRDAKLNDIYKGFTIDPKRSLSLCGIYIFIVGILGYLPYMIFQRLLTKTFFQETFPINYFLLLFIPFLLLLILFIYIALSLSQIFYIANDFPSLSAIDSIKFNLKIMKGNRLQLLKLHIHFIPWYLLSILTLGIALLWILPYLYSTLTLFYLDLINKQ